MQQGMSARAEKSGLKERHSSREVEGRKTRYKKQAEGVSLLFHAGNIAHPLAHSLLARYVSAGQPSPFLHCTFTPARV